jgi:hypothetical protein
MMAVRRNRLADPFATGLIPLAGGPSDFTDADQRILLKLLAEGIKKNLALRAP